MTPIVADTEPLIALGRVDRLDLLRRLYRQVVIPLAVLGELAIGSGRPGTAALGSTLAAGWISVQLLANHRVVLELVSFSTSVKPKPSPSPSSSTRGSCSSTRRWDDRSHGGAGFV